MIRQGDVVLDGQAQHEPVCFAIFGEESDAVPHGCGGRRYPRDLPPDRDPAIVNRIRADDRARQLRASGADEPRNAEDLAA